MDGCFCLFIHLFILIFVHWQLAVARYSSLYINTAVFRFDPPVHNAHIMSAINCVTYTMNYSCALEQQSHAVLRFLLIDSMLCAPTREVAGP